MLPLDADDAHAAGVLRAELEAAGRPIGAYDVLIAGMARRRSAVLVTANAPEFRRIRHLRLEDWNARRPRGAR